MRISAVRSAPVDGALLALAAQQAGSPNARCYRCGQDPEKSHDQAFFCPAFARSRDVGHWIQFGEIRRSLLLRAGRPLVFRYSSKMEDCEWQGGDFHKVYGVYDPSETFLRNAYMGRLDSPDVPEFSLWSPEKHTMLRRGWRCALRDLSRKLHIPLRAFERDLRVNLTDLNTEEAIRRDIGFL